MSRKDLGLFSFFCSHLPWVARIVGVHFVGIERTGMQKNAEPQMLNNLSVKMVRPDGSAMSPTTARSEEHEGCAMR